MIIEQRKKATPFNKSSQQRPEEDSSVAMIVGIIFACYDKYFKFIWKENYE